MTGQHQTVPRRFALVRYPDGDDSQVIVAWGIKLPDGSAVSASIDDQTVTVCSRAAHCELIHGAELVWIDDEIGDFEKERSS
ncbi:hypothetical protein ACTMSW_02160 [Micromonospora sp. BQ11]|uniref:hypothetical protein n=1 Tax=Micromonospora sp. BQ11 TaxID=3452212 RepID=UPI003F8AC79D